MFFEINNTIQDSIKLKNKRKQIKQLIEQRILNEQPTLNKINKTTFYCEDSMQIIKINAINIEKYTKNNFSF